MMKALCSIFPQIRDSRVIVSQGRRIASDPHPETSLIQKSVRQGRISSDIWHIGPCCRILAVGSETSAAGSLGLLRVLILLAGC